MNFIQRSWYRFQLWRGVYDADKIFELGKQDSKLGSLILSHYYQNLSKDQIKSIFNQHKFLVSFCKNIAEFVFHKISIAEKTSQPISTFFSHEKMDSQTKAEMLVEIIIKNNKAKVNNTLITMAFELGYRNTLAANILSKSSFIMGLFTAVQHAEIIFNFARNKLFTDIYVSNVVQNNQFNFVTYINENPIENFKKVSEYPLLFEYIPEWENIVSINKKQNPAGLMTKQSEPRKPVYDLEMIFVQSNPEQYVRENWNDVLQVVKDSPEESASFLDQAILQSEKLVTENWTTLLELVKDNPQIADTFFENKFVKEKIDKQLDWGSNRDVLKAIEPLATVVKYIVENQKTYAAKIIGLSNQLKEKLLKIIKADSKLLVNIIEAPYFKAIFSFQERKSLLIQMIDSLSGLQLIEKREDIYAAALENPEVAIDILANDKCYQLLASEGKNPSMEKNEAIVRVLMAHATDGIFYSMLATKKLGPENKKIDLGSLIHSNKEVRTLILDDKILCGLLSKEDLIEVKARSQKADQASTSQYDQYYSILGLEATASSKDLRVAYLKLVRLYNTDTGTEPNAEKFNEVTKANKALSSYLQSKEATSQSDFFSVPVSQVVAPWFNADITSSSQLHI